VQLALIAEEKKIPVNISMSLKQVALRFPHNPAITTDVGTFTYAQFEDSVARFSGGLTQRFALSRGSHVGIAMENCAEFLVVLYGIWRAGLVAIPINSKLHPREMEFILDNADARACFCTPEIGDRLGSITGVTVSCAIITSGSKDFATLLAGDAISEVSSAPEDTAWLFYTSGTTGRPKGAVLTHRNLQFMSHCYYSDVDQVDERDTKIHAAPLSHASGLYALPHIAKGSHQIILSSFDPERIFDMLPKHKNVTLFGAPTMVSRLINHPRIGSVDSGNLKTLYYGGHRCTPPTSRERSQFSAPSSRRSTAKVKAR
jgi:acyl-CoA synthetase (AMP-forming)/AMP-acid ligase II